MSESMVVVTRKEPFKKGADYIFKAMPDKTIPKVGQPIKIYNIKLKRKWLALVVALRQKHDPQEFAVRIFTEAQNDRKQ